MARDANAITLELPGVGMSTIAMENIQRMERTGKSLSAVSSNGERIAMTAYFLTGSAFSLPAGSGVYRNVSGYFNQASYGVSDRFDVGAGVLCRIPEQK